jgi:hypothetical protein
MFGNLFDIHHGKPCKSISFTGENELKKLVSQIQLCSRHLRLY